MAPNYFCNIAHKIVELINLSILRTKSLFEYSNPTRIFSRLARIFLMSASWKVTCEVSQSKALLTKIHRSLDRKNKLSKLKRARQVWRKKKESH